MRLLQKHVCKGDPSMQCEASWAASQPLCICFDAACLGHDLSNMPAAGREVKVTESSESVLAGTKRPPFRLVVRALIAADGRRAHIRPAVSEEFVVSAEILPASLVLLVARSRR